jgi:Purine catabolism regulatory protein-like family/PucR C-terminal helix-turn-helix domain
MPITLREILELDAVRRGSPAVVACAELLDRPVRWVHAVELTDGIARLLRGGELVLSTGIALPDSASLLESYVAELASVGVNGLAIELGRRYAGALPAPLVAAASAHGVVLIEFRHEVAFVEITEAVHTRIFEAREKKPELRLRGLLDQLRDDSRLRAFTDRELGPLLAHDAAHGTRLVGDLTAFLEAGGNKALAATRAHLARPTFYQRLRLIERTLGVSLADPESRAALHVALLARRGTDRPLGAVFPDRGPTSWCRSSAGRRRPPRPR